MLLGAARFLEDRHGPPVVPAEDRGEDGRDRHREAVRDHREVVPAVEVHPLRLHVVEDGVMQGGEDQDQPAKPPVRVHDQERHDHEEVEVHLDGAAADEHEQVGVGRQG